LGILMLAGAYFGGQYLRDQKQKFKEEKALS
jgi:hypothetical protein